MKLFMKLWLVKRNDSVGYDEYDSVVVRASTMEQARVLVLDAEMEGFTADNMVVEPLEVPGEPGIILGSYNAG
jgi:hypothetical protein